jgi:predicted Zn-dependent protease
VRFEIARARVLAALGDAGAAASRLGRVAEKEGESARLAAALAEIFLQSRSWAQAESAAMRAVGRDPKDPELRALVARARIGRGREIEALHATEGFDGRAVRIQRAIARYRLGQWAEARAELEKTGRDGKLPADAAVWFALVDVGSGKADRALPLLEKLLQANPPPPLASYAQGRALEAVGRTADAEAAYRAEAQREPLAREGHAALGRLLLATRRARDAVAPLERAVKLDPSDIIVRRSLAEALLATGQAAQARAELDIVLLSSPHDAIALRTLSAAWLSEGQAAEARRAADRAVAAAPKDPAVLIAAARAAAASGDIATTKRLGAKALKAGATGPDRDEARRLSQGQIPRKR